MSDYALSFVCVDLQPLTPKEASMIERALEESKRIVVILRDAGRLPSRIRPFDDEDRVSMMEAAFPFVWPWQMDIRLLPWAGYDDLLRCESVAHCVDREIGSSDSRVGLWGFREDEVQYLRRLPYAFEERLRADDPVVYDGLGDVLAAADPRLSVWIDSFMSMGSSKELQKEDADALRIRETYGSGPFRTADAVCVWRQRVLMIRRGNHPFRGALALPGGIVDAGEDPREAAIRELFEEVSLRAGNSVRVSETPRVYEVPGRDPRGDYRANAFLFDFSDLPEPPAPKAGDDAREALWIPCFQLVGEKLAFDHHAILHDMIGLPFPKVDPVVLMPAALA